MKPFYSVPPLSSSFPPMGASGFGESSSSRLGASRSTHGDTQTGPLRVLVVEDLPRVQALLYELIHEPGRFEVAGMAETEIQAIEQYHALLPEAVVIDLNLRQGTGLGVIAALRGRTDGVAASPKHGADAPERPLLIVLTNHALPVLEAACLNAGADYFLDKSREFHRVRTLLDETLVARRQRRGGDGGSTPTGAAPH